MSAWVLPDHIADVLPSEARHIEELRRELLDTARAYGYELVMPPMLEHLESLLSGTGEALDLQTFKLVDQLSGRSWACAPTPRRRSRASMRTCSIGRAWRACAIAAPCCTPGLIARTRRASRSSSAPRSTATRAWRPTSRSLPGARLPGRGQRDVAAQVHVDMADARIVRALSPACRSTPRSSLACMRRWPRRIASSCATLTAAFPAACARRPAGARRSCTATRRCSTKPPQVLPDLPAVRAALADLQAGSPATLEAPRVELRPGATCAATPITAACASASTRLAPATRWCAAAATTRSARCSAATVPPSASAWTCANWSACCRRGRCAPRSARPWSDADGCARPSPHCASKGETVVCVLPGHDSEIDEFHCDRELVDARRPMARATRSESFEREEQS